jgi:hypothetical protein
MDRSYSVGNPANGGSIDNVNAMKAATNRFLETVAGAANGACQPQIYMNVFASDVLPIYQPWGGGYADIPAERNPYTGGSLFGARLASFTTPFYSPPTYNQTYGPATNWQGAFDAVPRSKQTGKPDLVVMLTDGEPTWWAGAAFEPGNNSSTQRSDVEQAINAANRLKSLGTRVVVVRIGNDRAGENYIKSVSGPVEGSDYFYQGYNQLDSVMTTIANRACSDLAPQIGFTRSTPKNAEPGDTVTITYTLRNPGPVALTRVSVTDPGSSKNNCPTSLAVNATATCTATFTVPVNAPKVISGTATARGWGNGKEATARATSSVTVGKRATVLPT